ncbi:hypothetical protein GLOTRDRAFT_63901 [Gloeophyllum trabeum ATCC 11539]|uniref:Transcription factor TFIIIC triple barrel domain-containing protein n=1 Tax=Gloeophyllum trabeum (strain ATCC 11539 / FP-39264 / Madison 617) TaxID=670483 RepID=S7PZW6_GLOTA|nr:uncharacterized protein GLOTRDRAFT_63901 [Gloeophyllum trabeum ATCC 11539]EPQ53221.1 hypothetical protein GLOTRDRAFT_63901 [Gloeophyllum trabeum ATCC 11539]
MSGLPNTSLFPGYRQVDPFEPDEEYEEEEEVSYVTLDMGSIDPTLLPSLSAFRLIGLDTPTPFIQLGGCIFKGQHHNLLGTELLFTDEDSQPSRRGVICIGTSERRILFKEVHVKPRQAEESDDVEEPSQKPSGITPAVRSIESLTKAKKGRPGRRPKQPPQVELRDNSHTAMSDSQMPDAQAHTDIAPEGDEAMDIDET